MLFLVLHVVLQKQPKDEAWLPKLQVLRLQFVDLINEKVHHVVLFQALQRHVSRGLVLAQRRAEIGLFELLMNSELRLEHLQWVHPAL